uniref:Uncharacterized protein n=1 Tax=Arundo donax TaxID=35708 RepID=A0A0A9FFD5_ARUDO
MTSKSMNPANVDFGSILSGYKILEYFF